MKPHLKRCVTIFTIAVILPAMVNTVFFLNHSQPQLANALDFELSDFNCIAVVGNIGDNVCSKDNTVTNNDIVNHNTSFDCAATINQGNTATTESDSATVDQSNSGTDSNDFQQSNTADVDQSDTVGQSNSVEQCNLISLPL
jgi:hypothetical protein